MKSFITIVSGLPRSGTSLMMKMLDQGGLEIMTDHIRQADEDNPEGYYELEHVKKIRKDASWVKHARGKTFKMVSMLLLDLPPAETYKIIFMERVMGEILASQQKMLKRNNPDQASRDNKDQETDDHEMNRHFTVHLNKIKKWLENQKNIKVLPVSYNKLIVSPEPEIDKVIAFIDQPLNKKNMIKAVNPDLYRNRL